MDLPLVFNLRLALAQHDERDLPYRWDDSYRARLGVLRRDDPYGPVRWSDIEPCYVFHIANAYDSGNSIVLEVVRYPEMWRSSGDFDVDATLWRWTIELHAGDVRETLLDDRAVEFPRIDDRLVGAAARYSVAVGRGSLVRYDLERGTASEHRFGAARLPGVPGGGVRSIPRAVGRIGGLVLDLRFRPGSDLVIVDAGDFGGNPVARVQLSRRVPHGFHGNWISD